MAHKFPEDHPLLTIKLHTSKKKKPKPKNLVCKSYIFKKGKMIKKPKKKVSKLKKFLGFRD